MKVSVRSSRKVPLQRRRKVRGFAAHIYRVQKEVSPAWMRSSDILASGLRLPRLVQLRLVGWEASRLSKANRARVVTLQEINTAVALVQQRSSTEAAA